jgi:hypothetical protein
MGKLEWLGGGRMDFNWCRAYDGFRAHVICDNYQGCGNWRAVVTKGDRTVYDSAAAGDVLASQLDAHAKCEAVVGGEV